MDQLDASTGIGMLGLCPQIEAFKTWLGLAKMPSTRMFASQEAGLRPIASVGRITFKRGQKLLRKWYLRNNSMLEPLVT